MVLEGIGLLGVSSPRTKAYLQKMVRVEMCPSFVILMKGEEAELLPGQISSDLSLTGSGARESGDRRSFDPGERLLSTLERAGIPYRVVTTTDVNDPRIIEAVSSRPEEIFIYSAAGGAILRKEILSTGKKFLHIHPGLVPFYRGSTTLYYSILAEDSCGASAMFLAEKIDCGPVIRRKCYPPPRDGTIIDYIYDPDIRSDLLLEVLEEYRQTDKFRTEEQSSDQGETYYIIHPVLKHIAILSCARSKPGLDSGDYSE
jgi:methionyl-tRNA formyltransferase